MEFKVKTDKELESLNTKNLLAYYKAERKRFYGFVGSHTDDGETTWQLYSTQEAKEAEKTHGDWKEYLQKIKYVLSKREHVNRKINSNLTSVN